MSTLKLIVCTKTYHTIIFNLKTREIIRIRSGGCLWHRTSGNGHLPPVVGMNRVLNQKISHNSILLVKVYISHSHVCKDKINRDLHNRPANMIKKLLRSFRYRRLHQNGEVIRASKWHREIPPEPQAPELITPLNVWYRLHIQSLQRISGSKEDELWTLLYLSPISPKSEVKNKQRKSLGLPTREGSLNFHLLKMVVQKTLPNDLFHLALK